MKFTSHFQIIECDIGLAFNLLALQGGTLISGNFFVHGCFLSVVGIKTIKLNISLSQTLKIKMVQLTLLCTGECGQYFTLER